MMHKAWSRMEEGLNCFSMSFVKCQGQIRKNFAWVFILTHRGPMDLRQWAIFNTILMSLKSWLSQEDLDAGCEHSLVSVYS